MLIDTHAHLASSKYEGEINSIVTAATSAGVGRIVAIACDLEDSHQNLSLSRDYPSVVAPTAGIHPLYVHETKEGWLQELTKIAGEPGIAALGEIGLDYFHPPPEAFTEENWRYKQWEIFEQQLQLSIESDLPVVIHQRNSADDVTSVLRQFPKARAVLHCFTGTTQEAEAALEMGHFLSFTGILTFPNAPEVREVASMTPQDRIMLETDSPFLAPVPFRGKRCEPSMITHTASTLAEIHKVSAAEIAELTTRNAESFFNLCPNHSDLN